MIAAGMSSFPLMIIVAHSILEWQNDLKIKRYDVIYLRGGVKDIKVVYMLWGRGPKEWLRNF